MFKILKIGAEKWRRSVQPAARKNPIVTLSEASQLFPGIYDTEIRLAKLEWRFGNLQDGNQLIFLCCLARFLNAGKLFEFGTFSGRTTYNLALNTAPDSMVFTLDGSLDDSSNLEKKGYGCFVAGECFQSASEDIRKKIKFSHCDSRLFDYDPLCNQIDLILVDGGHTYDVVMSDSLQAFRMAAPGGVIVWDDYSEYWPGVKKALDEIGASKPLYWLEREKFIVSYSRS